MSRTKKSDVLRREMCARFKELVDEEIQDSIENLSRQLGYANSSTLRSIYKGDAFLDTERLARLSEIRTISGEMPNIHWLITGKGRLLAPRIASRNSDRDELMKSIERLPGFKVNALRKLLE